MNNYEALPQIKAQKDLVVKKDVDYKLQAKKLTDVNYLFEKSNS